MFDSHDNPWTEHKEDLRNFVIFIFFKIFSIYTINFFFFKVTF